MKRPGPRREFRLALFCVVSLCIASTPVPFSIQRALIDRIGEIGKTSDSARAAALQLLERLAEAHIDSVTADLIDTVGRREQLTGPEFTQPSVRAHALRRIGRFGGAEAVTYLAKLRRSDRWRG